MSQLGLETPLVSPLGELCSVEILVDPRGLEELLEVLSGVSFPINPEIRHPSPGDAQRPHTIVDFPVYSSQVDEVRSVIQSLDLPSDAVRISLLGF